ncbi:diguanylate cyclase [Roseomonas sp. 18066]|uniref:GGDEF domain-containing protein n=1 Tax=Roseomonas sp. 18066 TaxID=2681412 RepID=UPI00135AF4C1|nr:diguanylate cyclase [Roseomonas sp. 18066]
MAEPAPGAELEMRDALRRLRADGVQRLGERVRDLEAAWTALQPRRLAWDQAAREAVAELAASAHRLAGAGGTFGFPALSAAAAPLELILLGLRDEAIPSTDHIRQATLLIGAVAAAWEAGPDGHDSAAGPAAARSPAEAAEPVFLFAEPSERAMLSAVIANLGYAVTRLPELAEGAETPRIAAAVVDDAVPGALELCRRLAGRAPLVLLAGESTFEARLAAARAGVEAVVPKPLEVNELADWLDHFAGTRAEAAASILVVDDDALLAEAYALALRQAGMQVTAISDPAQAIAAIAAATPDLVLMDMQMPGIDGIELARVIRQTRRNLSLPILFLSAEQDPQKQMLARRLGGDDFIPKPVDLDRLVDLVRLRAERARALRAVMETDSLTGLLNHARFKERLGLELERAQRHGMALSLVLLDIDHFKAVNDTHGHLVGDRVIRGLSRSLQKRLRRTDVIGRYGGEEFAVLLLNTAPEAAAEIIDGIRARFAETPFETTSGHFFCRFSAGVDGIAAGAAETTSGEALISAADAALYAAKRAGRNRVTLAP